MSCAEGAAVAVAVDDGVTVEGVVSAGGVFDKLEQTMTHAIIKQRSD